MIKYCVEKWNKNKDKLMEVIENSTDHHNWGYSDLLEMIIENVLDDSDGYGDKWDSNEIKIIDHGDYQGTLMFLFHRQTYQPGAGDYMITYVGYGSCSGCDTLMAIQEEHYDYSNPNTLPTESQVRDYMTLCLHMIQRMKCPYVAEHYHFDREELEEIEE